MAKFDLTSVMGQYLDRHLVFPLLEFLSAKQIYDENELLHGKLDILSKTNMLDYAIDIRKQLYPDQEIPETFLQEENKKKPYLKKCYAPVCSSKCDDITTAHVCGLGGGISFSTVFDECYSRPTIVLEGKMKAEECRMSKALKERRVQVVSQLQELQEAVAPILGLLANEEAMKTMETNRDPKNLLNFLIKEYQITMEMMESLYRLAKYRYDCGNYSITTGYLYFYLLVVPTNDRNYLNVLWGKLASEILVQNWETALEDLSKLREFIDGSTFATPLELLQQRTWLIHWSLFVFFNHAKGRDLIIEMFLYRPHYLNAIQTMCPHILRYLATAVIINRTRRSAVKDLVKVIQQEAYTYRDPITEFLEHLLVNFDFDGARQKLHECQIVLFNDFFLIACLEEFIENARLMIFETFCRIHQCISISMLAEKLNMNPDEAECWIVNLIRNARLDAKIDSKLGHVVMGSQPLSPYQQLVEKIDTLSVRSEALQALIEKKLKSRTQDLRWGTQEF